MERRSMRLVEVISHISTLAELLGLFVLWQKIAQQGSASGVSGKTMIMYAIVYVLRQWMFWPGFHNFALRKWLVPGMNMIALLLVLDVIRSVFTTYRNSYQGDLDVLPLKYFIPACALSAFLILPESPNAFTFQYPYILRHLWAVELYMDVM